MLYRNCFDVDWPNFTEFPHFVVVVYTLIKLPHTQKLGIKDTKFVHVYFGNCDLLFIMCGMKDFPSPWIRDSGGLSEGQSTVGYSYSQILTDRRLFVCLFGEIASVTNFHAQILMYSKRNWSTDCVFLMRAGGSGGCCGIRI